MRKTKTEIKTTVDTSTQTPIEIALQIDENGMTSLRALYEFLELSPTQYSRWCNKNLHKNEFATEGIDYIAIRHEVENPKNQGGRPTIDYMLTSDFAKKLCMKANTINAEEARKYFIACEQGLKIATAKLQDKSHSNIEVLTTLNNITTTLSSITDRLTKLETQKPTLQIPKYSRWKSITFDKFKLLMNYVNDNSDQDLSLANTMNLVFKEVQDTYNVDFTDYTYMYKCEFGLPEDEKVQTLDVINHYKDLKDMFNLTLDSILEKLHIQTEKNTSWNIFDELAAKIN